MEVLVVLLMCFSFVTASPLGNGNWVVRRQDTDDKSDLKSNSVASDVPPRIDSMDIESNIHLRYASTKITSKVFNPSNVAQEASFHVILPDTAFISEFIMEIEGKSYPASVKEKHTAEQEYQQALNTGQTAGHVSTDARDSNQFNIRVNTEPGSFVIFKLAYEELLKRRRGVYEQAVQVNPREIVPRLSVRVNIEEVLPVTDVRVIPQRSNEISETLEEHVDDEPPRIVHHNETSVSIVYEPSADHQKKKSQHGLQGQFVVQYDVNRTLTEKRGGEIHVVDGYFVHFFAPSSLKALPKHVVFVLDTSGSMFGTKLEQIKQAMFSILEQLREDDMFSVIEFASSVREWDLRTDYESPEQDYWEVTTKIPSETATETMTEESFGPFDNLRAYKVTKRTVQRAKQFIIKMEAIGSTNINDALHRALKNAQSIMAKVKLAPLIVFLTDGEPTVGETQLESILSNLRRANNGGVVCIFTLAFGTEADYNFLTKISTQNRGFARKIYEAADASLQLRGFFEEIASPLLRNVQFVYETDATIEKITETKIANFFKGSEFVVAGQVAQATSHLYVTIDGDSADGTYHVCSDPIFPPLIENTNKHTTKSKLEKMWAYITIQELLKKRQNYIDNEELEKINAKALNLSLSYGFVTPLTSLVVVKPNLGNTTAEVQSADEAHSMLSVDYVPDVFASESLEAAFPQALPLLSAFESEPLPSNWQMSIPEAGTEYYEEYVSTTLQYNELVFSPENFIANFEHNTTHVTIPTGEEPIWLSWVNELPDKEYDACHSSYGNNSTIGYCKSLWKCKTINEDFDFSSKLIIADICVIENRYIGICCISDSNTSLASQYLDA